MKHRILAAIIILSICTTGCGAKKTRDTTADNITSSAVTTAEKDTLEEFKEIFFKSEDADPKIGILKSCQLYKDVDTGVCYAYFQYQNNCILVELLGKDGKPKQYSENDKNNFDGSVQNDFLVVTDVDTGVQYFINYAFNTYQVRLDKDGSIYH